MKTEPIKYITVKYKMVIIHLIIGITLSMETHVYPQSISVHDPVMIKQDSTFYLFSTGRGISVWSSPDMNNWKQEKAVFEKPPEWAVKTVPGFKGHIWAPDISFHNGKYYLFYSVSAFGKNTSCIGLATNSTLNPTDPRYVWTDHGSIIQSVPGRDMWNAIDPNLAYDDSGLPWLVFGSFWQGMKLVKMKEDLSGIAEPQEWHTVARRLREWSLQDTDPGNAAIEAPFIFKRDTLYYLFVSFDYCCRGLKSNYNIMVGRSPNIMGPYLDRDGVSMFINGGTMVVAGNDSWPGVGHNSAYSFGGVDYLIFHGYDASDNGKPKLLIREIHWDEAGWPLVSIDN